MHTPISADADLDTVSELVADAAFREGVLHVVHGEFVFTCELIRAVPDKAEEYWMGPLHRTRIPWTKCLMELTGIERCQVKELDEASPESQQLLAWEQRGGQYVVRLRTPFKMEFVLSMARLAGRCEDIGQLIWQR